MWLYNEQPFEEVGEYTNFVYLITNLLSGKRYIGKKGFTFSKTKTLKGKKKKYKVESDWRTYYSSSEELKTDVATLGESCFKREILRLCTSKGEATYFEAKYQFNHGVLETDGWYNGHIMCRVHKKHLTFLKK